MESRIPHQPRTLRTDRNVFQSYKLSSYISKFHEPHIQNTHLPQSSSNLHGFANFYRRFIKNFSKIALPLTTLTKKDTTWHWTTDQQNAFDILITALTSEPILALPQPKGQFRVEADSSNYAVGAVLSQKHQDKWHPIAYFSKSLNQTQRNYEIYDMGYNPTRDFC